MFYYSKLAFVILHLHVYIILYDKTDSSVQRVNDEPGKILNLLCFVYFFCKWAETFEKKLFFFFGQKQCFYLTDSMWEYFEKLTLKSLVSLTEACNAQRVDILIRFSFIQNFLNTNDLGAINSISSGFLLGTVAEQLLAVDAVGWSG